MHKEIRRISTFSSLPLLIFAVLYPVATTLLKLGTEQLERMGVPLSREAALLITYAVVYILILGGATLLFYAARKRRTGLRLGQVFCKPRMPWSWILQWFVIALAFVYAANYLTTIASSIFQRLTNVELQAPDMDFGSSWLGTLTLFFAVSVLAPFFEELFFRGTLYRHNEVLGQFFSIAVCGVSFGLWHMNYEQFLYTMVMGGMMAFIFAKTRSVLPVMLFHFGMNTYSALLSTVMKNMTDSVPDMDNLEGFAEQLLANPTGLLLIFGVALFVMLIFQAGVALFIVQLVRRKNRERNRLRGSFFPIGGGKRLLLYLSSPVTILTYILLIGLTVYNAFF